MKNTLPAWLAKAVVEEEQDPSKRKDQGMRERIRHLIADEAEARLRAQISLESADWAAAEVVLRQQCKILARRFPVLQEHDFETLLLKVRGKLNGIRKIQGSMNGYPAGLLAVLLENAASALMDERHKSKLLAKIGKLSADDRAILAMRLCSKLTIGEIAVELREPYASVASRIFRMMRKVEEG